MFIEWLELPDLSAISFQGSQPTITLNFLILVCLQTVCEATVRFVHENFVPYTLPITSSIYNRPCSLIFLHGHLTTDEEDHFQTLRGQIDGLDVIGGLQQIPQLVDNGAPNNALTC